MGEVLLSRTLLRACAWSGRGHCGYGTETRHPTDRKMHVNRSKRGAGASGLIAGALTPLDSMVRLLGGFISACDLRKHVHEAESGQRLLAEPE